MSTTRNLGNYIVFAALAVLLLAAPHFLQAYWRSMLTEILMWGLFALGFDIIFGKTGLLNFGMSAFLGVGSYGFALAVQHLGVGVWGGLAAALLASVVFSYFIALLVTRFGSHYFVVFTIIISMILFFLAMNLRELTGGDMGIILRLRTYNLGPWEFSLRNPYHKYYLVLGVVAVTYYMIARFFNSPLGRAIEAVKENEERIEVIGYDAKKLKLTAFILSGSVAGIAGGLYALINSSTNAELFFWIFSGKAVLWTVVGGVGTLWGSMLGAGIMVYLEDVLSSWFVDYYPILVGLLLIVLILLAPKGIIGSIQNRLAERKQAEREAL